MTNQELVDNLQAMTADTYLLKAGNMTEEEIHIFGKAWEQMAKKTKKIIIITPSNCNITPLDEFDFQLALFLLKAGRHVKRKGWTGYIYLENGFIRRSNDQQLHRFIQEDIMTDDWRLED